MPLFELQPHLDRLYAERRGQFTYTAHDLKDHAGWQAGLRAALRQQLGLSGRQPPDRPTAERLHGVERGAYVEEKYCLESGEGVQTPLYVLIPRRAPPYKPILVFHGHEPGAQYCLGNYPDAATAQANLAIDNNYAQALAEAGYLVGVVEQRGFGERLSQQTTVKNNFSRSCRHLSFAYLLQGRTLLGERCWDGMCAASYLLTRPDVIRSLGVTGHSGGGATALWLAALDERVRVSVVSGYFSAFRASILSYDHCECNYAPGILELVEMGDLGALLAPRPFCVLHGENDPIFPVSGAKEAFETVKRAYALHAAAEACALALHPGGHAYHHQLSRAWFARWLGE